MPEEIEFGGKVVDIDKRESEKGKTYFYLLLDEAGEEVSYGAWDKETFPVLEKTAIGDQVHGTYKPSGEFRNIKTIEVIGGVQQRLPQQLPAQPMPIQMQLPVIPVEQVRIIALNNAVQIVLKGMEPGKQEYPAGLIKQIANDFVNYVLKGE